MKSSKFSKKRAIFFVIWRLYSANFKKSILTNYQWSKIMLKIRLILSLAALFLLPLSLTSQHWPTGFNTSDVVGKLAGPYNQSVKKLKYDAGDKLYLCTWGDGLHTSINDGTTTTKLAALTETHVYDVAFGGNNVYVAGRKGGVWKSNDNGNSWAQSNEGLPTNHIKAIGVNNNGDVWACTAGYGAYRSTDQGATWVAANGYQTPYTSQNEAIFYQDLNDIIFTKNGDVIVSTYGGGMFRSEDNGATWRRNNSGTSGLRFFNGFSKDKNGKLFLCSNGRGLFESTTDGLQWGEFADPFETIMADWNVLSVAPPTGTRSNGTPLEPSVGNRSERAFYYDRYAYEDWRRPTGLDRGAVPTMAVNSKNEFILYQEENAICNSTNFGESWAFRDDRRAPINNKILAVGNGTIFIQLGNGDLQRSTDYGETWTVIPGFSAQPITEIQLIENRIYIVNGELRYSDNNGNTWTTITTPNPVLSFTRAPNGNFWALGLQGEMLDPPPPPFYKVLLSTNQGANWTEVFEQDTETAGRVTGKIVASPVNGNIFVSFNLPNQSVKRTTDNGASWINTAYNYANVNKAINDLQITQSGTIYVGGGDGLYRSTNNGNNFSFDNIGFDPIPGQLERTPEIMKLAIRSDQEIWAAMRSQQGLFRTSDGGAKWDSVNNSFNQANIRDMSMNADGDIYFITSDLHVVMNGRRMPVPTLNSPANNVKGVELLSDFKWNTTEKALLYEFQISESEEFFGRAEELTTARLEFTTHRPLKYSTQYYWRVRAKHNGNLSEWSQSRTFKTKLAPPVLISPENEARGVPVEAQMVWQNDANANTWTIQIAKDTEFADIVFEENEIPDSTIIAQNLEPITTYYWRVKATDEGGDSDWSEVWEFRTILGRPVLVYPPNSGSEIPTAITFLWESVEEAETYFIQISFSPEMGLSDIIFESNTQDINSQFYDNLAFNETYYWRVYANSPDGRSVWSDIWSFSTGLPTVQLEFPENNSIGVVTDVEFRWKRMNDADYYQIQVSKDPNFGVVAAESERVDDFRTRLGDFGRFETFYWRVRAIIESEPAAWSPAWKFRTVIDNVVLKSPARDIEGLNPNLVVLEWEATKGADVYELTVAADISFGDIVMQRDNLEVVQFPLTELADETKYYWKVAASNKDGESTESPIWAFTTRVPDSVEDMESLSNSSIVSPNPFNNELVVDYTIENAGLIEISVINVNGDKIAILDKETKQPGAHSLKWIPQNLASGTYYIVIRHNGEGIIKQVSYIR